MVRCLKAIALLALGLGIAAQAATAQDYPKRPISVIVPFAAGGATDVIARMVSEAMSRDLRQPIIIENVPGAGGITGSLRAKNAEADGYTLLVGHMGTHGSSFALYAQPRFDPRTDFEPIGFLVSAPIVLFTRPNLPADTLEAFTRYAKSQPITVGHSGVLDDADRLVADSQAFLDRIFSLQDVHVRAADRCGRDPDKRVQRTDIGDRLFIQNDSTGLDEDGRFHFLHFLLLRFRSDDFAHTSRCHGSVRDDVEDGHIIIP